MKPLCVIQSPFETRSGYGDMARDIVRHIVDLDLYDVKLISMPWGACPINALDPVKDAELLKLMVQPPIQFPRQPELFIQISVPNEFQALGKYNIGITAGIETTAISKPWVDGCNRMNLVLAISQHSVDVIKSTIIEEKAPDGRTIATHQVKVPVEVLHNCVHTDVFKKITPEELSPAIKLAMAEVKEKFCFLFVGHWLRGNIGEDRKNVGLLVRIFCETFKNVSVNQRPALVLKTSGAGFSIMDREEVLTKIKQVRQASGPNAPNVYLIHGELTEDEMNSLYNHPKIKAHVSFTKGEGFGRPLLEATMSQKPVIASGWSGQLDFLNKDDAILLPGELKQVEKAAVWENVIIPESAWFNVDMNAAASALMWAFKRYDTFLLPAKRLARKNAQLFGYDVIKNRTAELLERYVPKMAIQVPVKLPSLKKIGRDVPSAPLPVLKKLEPKNAETQ